MGMSTTVYLGPYIKFEKESVKVTEEVEGCAVCRKQDDFAFCPTCGTKCSVFQREKSEDKVDSFELTDKINQRLFAIPNNDGPDEIYLPNRKITGIKRMMGVQKESGDEEITQNMMAEELHLFQTFFKEELAVMEKAYGEESGQVKWGIVTYWS